MVKEVRALIKKKKQFKFVYSPAGVYEKKDDKYPVIKFIDELTEDEE